MFWSGLIAWTILASHRQEIVEGWIAPLVLDDFDKDLTGLRKPVRSAPDFGKANWDTFARAINSGYNLE